MNNSSVKECAACKKIKSVTEFYKSNTGKYGLQSFCKECVKEYYENNKDRILELHKGYRNDVNKYKRQLIGSSLCGHENRGFIRKVTIDECMEMDNDYCYYCGCKLEWECGTGHSPESPTIDRLHNDTILTKENIVFACYACNSGKNNGTLEEYIARCERVIANKENILKRR